MRAIDLTGQRFGLLVAEYVVRHKQKRHWHCQCDCGRTVEVEGCGLRSGNNTSCGCRKENLVGQTFNHLTAIERIPGSGTQRVKYLCRCTCGNTKVAGGSKLKQGIPFSCGCISLYRRPRGKRISAIQCSINSRFGDYKSAAKKRGRDFKLDKERFAELVLSSCHYCGGADDPINGIDRVDNEKGYIEGNVVPCCKTCNYRKREADYNEFVAWARRVTEHLSNSIDYGVAA